MANNQVSYIDFEKALNAETLKTFQIIQAGLAAGILSFMGIVLVMSIVIRPSPSQASPDSIKLISVLTCVNLLGNLVSFVVAQKVFQKLLWKGEAIDAIRCLQQIRQAFIIRLAILEGTTFFGLVIGLLCVIWGIMRVYPQYWINLLPVVSFALFVIKTFPNKEKIEGVFTKYFSA